MSPVRSFRFAELDSTNRYARREFTGLPDGALIVADLQTAGRGRLGRSWASAGGKGIYASLVMKQCPDVFAATTVISLGALAMLEAEAPGVPVWIKWPNDLYVGGRKLAGVLCETRLGAGNRCEGVIAGIGINVNQTAEELAAIERPATSLAVEKNEVFCLKKLLARLESELERCYITMIIDLPKLKNDWRKANRLIGCEIDLETASGLERGRVLDIDDDGMLVFAGPDGTARKVCSGDVRITRESLSRLTES